MINRGVTTFFLLFIGISARIILKFLNELLTLLLSHIFHMSLKLGYSGSLSTTILSLVKTSYSIEQNLSGTVSGFTYRDLRG